MKGLTDIQKDFLIKIDSALKRTDREAIKMVELENEFGYDRKRSFAIADALSRKGYLEKKPFFVGYCITEKGREVLA